MSSPQTRNKINLVFSEGSKCKRRTLKSQAIWYAFVEKNKQTKKQTVSASALRWRGTLRLDILLMCKCKCFSPFVLFLPSSQAVTWLTSLISKKAPGLIWLKVSEVPHCRERQDPQFTVVMISVIHVCLWPANSSFLCELWLSNSFYKCTDSVFPQ